MSSNSGTFAAYAIGTYYASACTSLNDADAAACMNSDYSDAAWSIAAENFANGDPNGRPCNQHPDTHRHILFTC